MKNETKQIGEIGVDAGLCWIGDPCYILNREGKDKEDLEKVIGKTWSEFCDKLHSNPTAQFNYPMGHAGLGVCFGGFGGDGTYPVYAEYEDGLIKRVYINFNVDEDEEDNE